MAANTLFFSADYLKTNSPIPNNTDSELLVPFIILAQEKYILPNCGTALYNKIITDIQTNSLSGNYETLMQTYIQPCLVYYVQFEALPFIASQLTNIGVSKKSSDNSTPAEPGEVKDLEMKVLQSANYYSNRMIRYLRANESLFPEFVQYGTGVDTIPPVSDQYFSGIGIPPFDYNQFLIRRDSRDFYSF